MINAMQLKGLDGLEILAWRECKAAKCGPASILAIFRGKINPACCQ